MIHGAEAARQHFDDAAGGTDRVRQRLNLQFRNDVPSSTRRLGARYLSARNARTHSAQTGQPLVALTFDDGPSRFSSDVLASLRDFDAPAAFFLVGRKVARYPAVVRAEVEAGNVLGNHTYTHRRLMGLQTTHVMAQLEQTQRAVESVGGVTPRWFRPPFGSIDSRIFAIAASLGLITASWTVDPRDYERPGVERIKQQVLDQVRPGSIILMHDGGGDRRQTVEALPAILSVLGSRGYHFVTLDELYT